MNVKIDKLIPYVNNARTHNTEQINKLRASIREFGFINPVIIDDKFNIIAGHGRVMAARAEGIDEVPCVLVSHLSEAQKKAYIIADNRLAEDAGWDEEILRAELEALQEEEYDLSFTGFERDEIDKLLAEEEVKEDIDTVPQVSQVVYTQKGDIWTLGKHRLMCGDSTEAGTYELLMQGEKANLIVTDPPYNVGYTRLEFEGHRNTNPHKSIMNDKMTDEEFRKFILSAFVNMQNVLADDGSIYVFHPSMKADVFLSVFREAGFELENICIWVKNNFALSRSDYQWKHEPVIYGFKNHKARKWYGARTQTTVWEFDRYNSNKLHPTSKPVEVVVYPIRNSSLTNSIVLDPFAGSGTTLIACAETDRICRAIELDPKFVDVIVKRYVDIYGDNGVKKNDTPYKEVISNGGV